MNNKIGFLWEKRNWVPLQWTKIESPFSGQKWVPLQWTEIESPFSGQKLVPLQWTKLSSSRRRQNWVLPGQQKLSPLVDNKNWVLTRERRNWVLPGQQKLIPLHICLQDQSLKMPNHSTRNLIEWIALNVIWSRGLSSRTERPNQNQTSFWEQLRLTDRFADIKIKNPCTGGTV